MYNNTTLQNPSFYKVGIYIRLSKEDEGKKYESDSESVTNQRNVLKKFVNDKGFTLIDEYIDDGFSGTNFDRPGFLKLIDDINKGRVNCVITKDSSRLGRDYITCGYYIEQFFPLNKVRYISVLDNIDTFDQKANNDIAPFKNVLDDMYSKENGKKVRLAFKAMKESGKFIGSLPAYGYMRDPDDKNHLIPDPITAPIVRKIFFMASNGVGISDIITNLNSEGIKTPSAYKGIRHSSQIKDNSLWTVSSINKILKNRMYIGDMVQNVQTKISYKSKKKVALDKSQWIIVEDTHEPLVDRDIWSKIQNSPARTRKTCSNRPKRILENLMFCKECGNQITVVYRRNKNYWTANCNKYSRDPRRRFCTPHFLSYDRFESIILDRIRITCEKEFGKLNIKELSDALENNNVFVDNITKEKDDLGRTITSLENKLDLIYSDKLNGLISADQYLRVREDIEKKIEIQKNRVTELSHQKETQKEYLNELSNYEDEIKKLLDLKEPNRNLIHTLVEKIIIDEYKNVEIVYKFKLLETDRITL